MQYESYFVRAGFSKEELLSAVEGLSKINSQNPENLSYVHGDLYSRHLLVDAKNNLSVIIDWGDIHIGNPGIDLSIGYTLLSSDALELFFDSYGNITQEMKDIAIARAFCHSIILLAYCFEQNEENLKMWTILALRNAINRCEYSVCPS